LKAAESCDFGEKSQKSSEIFENCDFVGFRRKLRQKLQFWRKSAEIGGKLHFRRNWRFFQDPEKSQTMCFQCKVFKIRNLRGIAISAEMAKNLQNLRENCDFGGMAENLQKLRFGGIGKIFNDL
jgi:hypothetical protein